MGRLVFVSHDMVHSHQHYNGLQVNNVSIPIPPSPVDIMYRAAMAAREFYKLTQYAESTVRWRPYDATDTIKLEMWVEQNTIRDVIAITGAGYDGQTLNGDYELNFLDGWHAATAFSAVYNKKPHTHFKLLMADFNTAQELVTWIDRSKHRMTAIKRTEYYVVCNTDNDAVEFKLRWGDYIVS